MKKLAECLLRRKELQNKIAMQNGYVQNEKGHWGKDEMQIMRQKSN